MPGQDELFADLILPLPLQGLFTYSVPDEFKSSVAPGMRVIVQFGKKKFYSAIVYKVHKSRPEDYKTKKILSSPDSSPVILPVQLKLWNWMSDYYMCSAGEVYKAAVPAGLKLESETFLYSNPSFNETSLLSKKEKTLYKFLLQKKCTTAGEVSSVEGVQNGFTVIKKLVDKGAIFAEESIKMKSSQKTEKYLKLSDEIKCEQLEDICNKLRKAPRQLQVVQAYIDKSGNPQSGREWTEIPAKELMASTGVSSQTLNTLVKKGIFSQKNVLNSGKSRDKQFCATRTIELSKVQHNAICSIREGFREKDVVLLYGVTSSGKTEIYIQLIKEFIQKGKQVLYLLPEIGVTTQIVKRLRLALGRKVGVYHSGISGRERMEVWNNVLNRDSESYSVIIGVRSSIFLPFRDLGLVIADEEHENTYKQFDPAPRYNARDSAVMLSKIHGGKTLLGTATPSVETYFNAKSGKYGLVKLDERFGNTMMPEIKLADVMKARKKREMKSHFTPELLEEISETLEKKEQVILFQNRRGFAPFLECRSCGWIPQCRQCDVSLTYHSQKNSLICHYCGRSQNIPQSCTSCNSGSLNTCGFGTQRIESDLAVFFPGANIARMDYDSTRKKKSYEKIIDRFEKGETDILVGTQMITKGLDFDNVSLVGILNGDNLLHYPDFRSHERCFQLISQVSGRAGRKEKRGKVIIQTCNPDHDVFRHIIEGDYDGFFTAQIMERKQFGYPPFYRLIKITLKHKNPSTVEEGAGKLAEYLYDHFGDRVLGPDFPLVPRIQNWSIKNILIKIKRSDNLTQRKKEIKECMEKLCSISRFRMIKIIPDVDPL